MSDPFFVVAATLLGAIVGSFLNAVIYRLPRARDGARFGKRSQCPQCGAPIPAWLNIPVLAWVALRGRAKCCGARIHWRYPLIEALTAVLFGLLAWAPPSGHPMTHAALDVTAVLAFTLHAYFVGNLIANTFIDIDFRILPDRLTKPLMGVGLVGAIVVPGLAGTVEGNFAPWASSLLASALGLCAGFGSTWAIRALAQVAFKKEAMGFGDVKLMGGIGAFLGWQGAFLAFFLGCIAGALIGIVLRLVTKDSYIAFGPYLVIGALTTLFAKGPIVAFWTETWPRWLAEHLRSPLQVGVVAVVCVFLLFVLIRRGRNS